MPPLARSILVWLAVAAAVVGAAFLTVRGYEGWRAGVEQEGYTRGAAAIQKLWDDDSLERGRERQEAILAARMDEAQVAAEAAQGERDAHERDRTRLQAQADAARRSAAAAGSLRDQLAALDDAARASGAPDAAACPGRFAQERDAAIRARAVLGACAAEHRLLAEDADAERRAIQLQLETAVSWIRATGAPGADQ